MESKSRTIPSLLAPYITKAIADGAGVTAETVRGWRSGQLPGGATTIQKLAQFLNLTAAELLEIIASEEARRSQAVA